MIARTCRYEREVVMEVRAGHWPEAADPALREHAANCATCGDAATVAMAFQPAGAGSMPGERIAPGLLWWRAQLRRRNDAMRQITRPILVTEIVAIVCTVGALIAALWQLNKATGYASWFHDIAPAQVSADSMSLTGWVLLVGAVGIFAAIGGLAVYLIAQKD